jgi:hypothetical protein
MRLRNIHIMILGFLVCFMTAWAPVYATDTQWNVGVSGGSKGIEGFQVSIGNYYHVPQREVVVVHERGIHEEELPVVFFIAQRAHVKPEAVVDLRLRGMSWMDVTIHFGLSPEIYYVPVKVAKQGPPYGHAYGYYKKHPKGNWHREDLRDEDIINQVNLKFISEHHRYAPDKVMKYRSEGRSFPTIDHDIRYQKQGKAKYQGSQGNKHEGKGQGKDKSKKSDG